jgi:hypothetical protein
MRISRIVGIALVLIIVWLPRPGAGQARHTDRVVLITLDGVRTQEIFGGLDVDVLRAQLKEASLEDSTVYGQFWAETPAARRQKLMPFFWTTLMTSHGSIGGNRARGSVVELANRRRFSYPGYAEILTGAARDEVITSNDNRRYPFPSVLEFIRDERQLDRAQVAVFASWETFNWIAEHREGALTINAGYEPFETADPAVRLLSDVQTEARTPWDTARHDAVTFRLAMAHLAAARPHALYIALDETDDWAHDGRYDRVLQSLHTFDGYLRTLWTWLQAQDDYRDRTALVVTVDHGRGRSPADWSKHGADVPGANEIWVACIGPDWPRRGEWADVPAVTGTQIAATLARALGLDFTADRPDAGRPIDLLWQP